MGGLTRAREADGVLGEDGGRPEEENGRRRPSAGGGEEWDAGADSVRPGSRELARRKRVARRCCWAAQIDEGKLKSSAMADLGPPRVLAACEMQGKRKRQGVSEEGKERRARRLRPPYPRRGAGTWRGARSGGSARLCLLAEVEEERKRKGNFDTPLGKN